MDKFIVGSNYFFSCYSDFKPHDIDILILVDHPQGFKNFMQISSCGECTFMWRRMPAKDFIEIALRSKLPMSAGKFLCKEFCEEIGFTIDDLKQLKNKFYNMDVRHTYEKIIYDAYIQNNSFTLTDEQRKKAYNEYVSSRKVELA